MEDNTEKSLSDNADETSESEIVPAQQKKQGITLAQAAQVLRDSGIGSAILQVIGQAYGALFTEGICALGRRMATYGAPPLPTDPYDRAYARLERGICANHREAYHMMIDEMPYDSPEKNYILTDPDEYEKQFENFRAAMKYRRRQDKQNIE